MKYKFTVQFEGEIDDMEAQTREELRNWILEDWQSVLDESYDHESKLTGTIETIGVNHE